MKRAIPSLTFIVPGLIDPVPYLAELPVNELPELPLFSKILSRGKTFTPESPSDRPDNFYRCLLDELSTSHISDADAAACASVAALSYAFDLPQTEISNKWIMRADPSFLIADRDQLVMAQSGSLGLSLEEAMALADEVNQFFSDYTEEDFWCLKALSPERWYIVSEKPINIPSIPPENVLGQSVKRFLFNTDNEDGRHWMNLFNEIQMILHQSDINKKRLAEKKIPVNSLWFWGAGAQVKLPEMKPENNSDRVYSDNFIACNIAQWNSKKYKKLPECFAFEQLLSDSNNPVEHLTYVVEDFIAAVRNKDIFSWVGLLQQFEENYLASIITALNNGKLKQLEFVSPGGKRLLITKKLLKRWWKKQLPYQSCLQK